MILFFSSDICQQFLNIYISNYIMRILQSAYFLINCECVFLFVLASNTYLIICDDSNHYEIKFWLRSLFLDCRVVWHTSKMYHFLIFVFSAISLATSGKKIYMDCFYITNKCPIYCVFCLNLAFVFIFF